jgi:hypothetical protein
VAPRRLRSPAAGGRRRTSRQNLSAFRVAGAAQLSALRAHCEAQGLPVLANATPLFVEGFSINDPDGQILTFGLPDPYRSRRRAPARRRFPGGCSTSSHATTDLPRLIEFYVGKLGFRTSNRRRVPGNQVTATFWRWDAEHQFAGGIPCAQGGRRSPCL